MRGEELVSRLCIWTFTVKFNLWAGRGPSPKAASLQLSPGHGQVVSSPPSCHPLLADRESQQVLKATLYLPSCSMMIYPGPGQGVFSDTLPPSTLLTTRKYMGESQLEKNIPRDILRICSFSLLRWTETLRALLLQATQLWKQPTALKTIPSHSCFLSSASTDLTRTDKGSLKYHVGRDVILRIMLTSNRQLGGSVALALWGGEVGVLQGKHFFSPMGFEYWVEGKWLWMKRPLFRGWELCWLN